MVLDDVFDGVLEQESETEPEEVVEIAALRDSEGDCDGVGDSESEELTVRVLTADALAVGLTLDDLDGKADFDMLGLPVSEALFNAEIVWVRVTICVREIAPDADTVVVPRGDVELDAV